MDEKLFDTIKRVSADDAVRTCMMEYQRYLADTKLPHPVDGLKDVSRRAIYVMNTRKDSIKFAQFIASIMEMHPHGDSSIQSAVERLFRPYDTRIPLITGTGNIGSYTEVPSAPRYLEVMSSEFGRDLFFNGVHQSTIPMQYTVEYNSIEPKYFIPRLPNALLMGNLTIGLGFKSVIFPISINDVCILVMKYIEHSKRSIEPFTSKGNEHHFLPDFPTYCYLRNESDLLHSYKEGNFNERVFTDGLLIVDRHVITLKNVPALLPFKKVHQKMIDSIKDKNHWINTYLKDFKDTINEGDHGSLKMIFKNNVDTWKILPRIKQMINFTSSLTPSYIYENEGKLVTLTPPEVLRVWYEARYRSIVNGLNFDQNRLLKDHLITTALILIADHKDEVVDIVKAADNKESAIMKLSERFDITPSQATAITRSSIDKLVKASKDELYKQKEEVETQLVQLNEQFTRVPSIIYDDAAYFRKKYSNTRRTLIPNYIGYIHIGDYGLYQYETENDMFNTLNMFTGLPMTIHQYKYPNKKRMVLSGNKIEEFNTFSIPRQTTGQSILELGVAESRIHTIAYVGDTVSCVKGFQVPKDDKIKVQYVTETFLGIYRDGKCVESKASDLSIRKSISSGARSDLVYAVPHGIDYYTSIAVYMSASSSYTNMLFLTRLFNSKRNKFNKLLTTPPHDLAILDIVDEESTGIIVNLHRHLLNVALDYVYITDVSKLMIQDTVQINLRGGAYKLVDKTTCKPSRHSDCSTMVVI